MTLIQVKKREVLDMPSLFRRALKYIYDRDSLTVAEVDQMMTSVNGWVDHIKLKLESTGDLAKYVDSEVKIELNPIDEENQFSLEIIGTLLEQDSKGEFDKRKVMFKEKGICYKKFHRLPESFTALDFFKGRQALEAHKIANPEDYKKN